MGVKRSVTGQTVGAQNGSEKAVPGTPGVPAARFQPDAWVAAFARYKGEGGVRGDLEREARSVGAKRPLFLYHFNKWEASGAPPRFKHGPPPRLTTDIEAELHTWILTMLERRMPVSRVTVMLKAKRLAVVVGIPEESVGGKAWLEGYLARHPHLCLRLPQQIEDVRLGAPTTEGVNIYFNNLEVVFVLYKQVAGVQTVNPVVVYDMDECSVSVRDSVTMVIGVRGQPVQVRYTPQSFHVSLVACGNAAGELLLPTLIFQGTRRMASYLADWPEAYLDMTDSGYQDGDSLARWAANFVEQTGGNNILVLDNHSSRLDPLALEIFLEANVHVATLPPHTTHLTQPLDRGFFRSFKQNLAVQHQLHLEAGEKISKDNIASIIRPAFEKSATIVVNPLTGVKKSPLISGFEAKGCFPMDRGKILGLPDVKEADRIAAARAVARNKLAAADALAALGAGAPAPDPDGEDEMEEEGENEEEDVPAPAPPLETPVQRAERVAAILKVPEESMTKLRKLNEGRRAGVSTILTGAAHVKLIAEKIEKDREEARLKAERAWKREMRRRWEEALGKPPSTHVAAMFAKPKGPAVILGADKLNAWDVVTGPGPKVKISYTCETEGGNTEAVTGIYNVGWWRAWARARNAAAAKDVPTAPAAAATEMTKDVAEEE